MGAAKAFASTFARALDPKREIEKDTPRPLLFAKYAAEYLFKLVSFFILLCVVVGLVMTDCSPHPVISAFPLFLGACFIFYGVITTLGIPVFLMIGEIKSPWQRRLTGYTIIIALFALALFALSEAPIFQILEAYVAKYFPEAFNCDEGLLELQKRS